MACESVVKRYEGNPIVTPQDVPGGCDGVFNGAVISYGEEYRGIFRVEVAPGYSQFRLATSQDGIHFEVDSKDIVFQYTDPDMAPGSFIYDPRITKLEGRYYITYCNVYHGPAIGLAETQDFKTFHQICNPFPPNNRNAVLFPRRIKGKFVMLHRPCDAGHTTRGDIFCSSSEDLIHWGEHRFVFGPGRGWQSLKVGAGPPPIETEEGWLLIYHGVRQTCSGYIYSVGAALLDLEEPWRVIYRTNRRYLMAPTEDYERVGNVPNVVFPTSAILDEKTGRLSIYYGGADTVMALAFAEIKEIIDFVKDNN